MSTFIIPATRFPNTTKAVSPTQVFDRLNNNQPKYSFEDKISLRQNQCQTSLVSPQAVHNHNTQNGTGQKVHKENQFKFDGRTDSIAQKFQNEIDRLTQQINDKTLEIETLKKKNFAYDQEKATVEQQLQYFRGIAQQNEQIYYTEFAKSREQYEQWKTRCQELELKVRETTTSSQEALTQATQRIALLSIEVERLNSFQKQRAVENETNNSQFKLTTQQNEQKLQERLLEQKDREINALRNQIKEFKQNHTEQQSLQNQNEQLQKELMMKSEQIYKLQQELTQLKSNQTQIEKFQAEQQINNAQRANQTQYEKIQLEQQLNSTFQRLRDYEKQISSLNNQIENYKCMNEEKQQQIAKQDEQKQQILDQHNQYEVKISLLVAEIDRLHQNNRSKVEDIERLRQQKDQQSREWDNKISTYQQENQRVSLLLRQSMEENDRLIQQYQQYRDYANEVETWKRKFCELNRDFHSLQEQKLMCQAELEAQKAKQIPNIR